jgi:hypothetical protein
MRFLQRVGKTLQIEEGIQEVRQNALGQQCSRRPDRIRQSSRHGWCRRRCGSASWEYASESHSCLSNHEGRNAMDPPPVRIGFNEPE